MGVKPPCGVLSAVPQRVKDTQGVLGRAEGLHGQLVRRAGKCHTGRMSPSEPAHPPLSASVVDTHGRAPEKLVVLCHGYGAPGNDLVAVARTLQRHLPETLAVRFILPQAPLSLDDYGMPQGRAWWHLDLAAMASRQLDIDGYIKTVRGEAFVGIASARRALMQLINQELNRARLSASDLYLAGFSQGAMLATEVALRLEEPPAALGIFSGTLTDEAQWRRLATKRAGLPVLMSHGRSDPILPYSNAIALKELLQEAGCAVTFTPFDDGHTIVDEAVAAFAAAIA
jgi:phospholipase/carboxylesterase